ncbi:MAG TPA: archaellin/type IV pilin N-terminal domain-containing protein, partial [Acidobacteriota bacterium]|nr:archaellin/type IV pilin N-terminal domain-containing protein [Acidobacteriota bacterium]
MKNFRKSRKALSPVVASIILIAVTVAVSIAVAAWMGALTVGFMGTSSLNIGDASFPAADQVVLSVKNTGTKTVTIASIKVNSNTVANWTSTATGNSMAAGENCTVTLTQAWTAGNPYKFDLYDGSGQVVGAYQATAP